MKGKVMSRATFLLCATACLGIFAIAGTATTVSAETLVPCCEGGFRPDKRCQTDADCIDICRGGFRDGRPCTTSPCLDACVGGFDDGKNCEDGRESKCRDACVGGTNDGALCRGDADCPDGSCSNLGSCSNQGVCLVSTCTGLCEKKRPRPSPSEPVSTWSQDVSAGRLAPEPCP